MMPQCGVLKLEQFYNDKTYKNCVFSKFRAHAVKQKILNIDGVFVSYV